MFSAGMGIGLMFYGVSETLTHFVEPPPGAQPGIGTAMATTLFHWTVHPWAMYAVMGLALAYGTYRRGWPQLISAAFWPLLGRTTARGPVSKAIDIRAIFATLFGSAASLGLGALLGTLSQRGNQDPQRWNVIFWGAATGAVAVIMLLVGGATALSGLQTLTIIAAAPFALLMIFLCVSLARDLRTDPMIVADHAIEQQLREQHHNGSNGSVETREAVSSTADRPVTGR